VIIGVLKEMKEGEMRVALTPAGVNALVRDGHTILVEKEAGKGSGITDDDYIQVGAQITSSEIIYKNAELVVKVKEPLEHEIPLYHRGQILFTYLHLASSRSLTEALLKTGITGIAYETVQKDDGGLPLLIPMSEVAGRISIQVAMRFLETDYGGRGILLSGVPGVPPAEVVVLGCGVAGFNAAKMAAGLGAHVTIIDINHEKLRYVEDVMHGNVTTIFSNHYNIERAAGYADILIGSVLVPGARAPVLVTETMVSRMKAGAVIIDISVDQGGCVETTHPTTHAQPVFTTHDVIHYGVPNMPAAVPRTSTYALTNATLPYIQAIASKGVKRAALDDLSLAKGINLVNGVLTHPAVAGSFSMPWQPWDKVL